MKGRKYMDDDCSDEDDDRHDGGGGDWRPGGEGDYEDDEPDESSDSDYGAKRKSRKPKKAAAAPKPRAAKAAARRPPQKKAKRRYSSDEESEFDSEEEEEEDWAAVKAAADVARPRRQAAQKANANIKHTYEASDEEGGAEQGVAAGTYAAQRSYAGPAARRAVARGNGIAMKGYNTSARGYSAAAAAFPAGPAAGYAAAFATGNSYYNAAAGYGTAGVAGSSYPADAYGGYDAAAAAAGAYGEYNAAAAAAGHEAYGNGGACAAAAAPDSYDAAMAYSAAAVPASYDNSARAVDAAADADYEAEDSGDDDDEYDAAAAGDDDDEDDFAYAQQVQEAWNGLRTRNTRSRRAAGSSPSPPPRGSKRSAAWSEEAWGGSHKRSKPVERTSRRAVAKVSYAESGDSDSDEAGRGSQARMREPVPALDDLDESKQQPDDEVERVLGHRDVSGAETEPGASHWDTVEFHIKWKRFSYTHCTWERLGTLKQLAGFKRVTNYCKRAEMLEASRNVLSREELELQDVQRQMEEELVEQYTQVERIVAERPGVENCLLVKWQGLPYCECTWESEQGVMSAQGGPKARDEFQTRQQRLQEPSKGVDAARSSFVSSKRSIEALAEQPSFLAGGKLRDYQLDGINWLTYAWIKDRNCILADEMGLGKTVQCVSYLGILAETCMVRGPFLVVVPLSTVPNWIKEFRKWVPQLNAIVYVGDGRSREVIRAFEFGGSFSAPGCSSASNHRSRPYNFEVLITTYELALKDAALLGKVNWAYMMVDEAHRLKNSESALYQELVTWHFKNKLLITGTPLQNSLKELWALLHFLEPSAFGSCEDFEATYSLDDSEQVAQLHATLKPHLLRRVIKDVEKSLPPKNERILRVEMTPLQRQYYKWILSRNFKELNKGARSGGHVSLLNIISELKKACNHPFLFESAEDEYRGSEEDKSVVDRLILTSGKMVLLDKLMRRLRETGHRVLVFSQMVRVLDIISDYLRLRGYPHQRLDGSTPAAARHQAMEAFNKPDSPDFAFLLSTRAGGLGINLATADTVVIFDSDWNPQNDLQAMSRAHRIGQTETVNIYRFVTSGSVEEEILERAKRKMVLDHLVIQRMDTSGRTVLDPAAAAGGNKNAKAMFGKEELAAILRFGAEDLFKAAEEGSAERSRRLLEEDIDDILQRAEVVEQVPAAGGDGAAAELLSSFNVATFKNEEDDATFWSRLIREEDRPPEHEELLLPRTARLNAAAYNADNPRSRSGTPLGGSDAEQEPGATPSGKAKAKAKKAKGGSKKRHGGYSHEPGPPVEGAVLRVDEWVLDVDETGRPLPKQEEQRSSASPNPSSRSLCRKDATAFVRAVRRYGLKAHLPAIAAEVGGVVQDAGPAQQLSLWRALVDGCKAALEMAEQPQDAKDVTLDFFGCAVKAADLSHHLGSMSLLTKRIDALTAAQQDPYSAFRLEAAAVPPAAKWGKTVGWTPRDDAALLLGVYYYGLGHWEEIIGDEQLGLQSKLACVLESKDAGHNSASSAGTAGDKALHPKASHLETRVLGILRKMWLTANKGAAAARPAGHRAAPKPAAGGAAHPLPPKKAAAARAAALAAAGITVQRKQSSTPPPAAVSAVALAAMPGNVQPLPAAAARAAAAAAAEAERAKAAEAEKAKAAEAERAKAAEVARAREAATTAVPPPPPAPSAAALDAVVAAAAAAGAVAADASGHVPLPPLAISAAAGSGPSFSQQQLQEQLSSVADDLQALLQLADEDLEPRQVMALTKKHLLAIGHAVEAAAAQQPGIGRQLWRYVISYIKSPVDDKQIVSLYNKISRGAAAAAAAAAAGAAAATAAGAAGSKAAKSEAAKGKAEAAKSPARPKKAAAAAAAGKVPAQSPPNRAKKQPTAAAGAGGKQPTGKSAAHASTPPSAARAAAVCSAGKAHNQKPHQQKQQQLPPLQQHPKPAIVHTGPRRALQLNQQPQQHPHLQQQQHDPQPQHKERGRRSRSSSRSRSRGRARSRSRSADRHARYSRHRSSSRDRGRSRSNSRGRHDLYRDRGRDRQDRDRAREDRYHDLHRNGREHYRHGSKRSRSYSRSRSRGRHRSHSRDRDRHRDRGYSRSHSRGRSRSRSKGVSRSQSWEAQVAADTITQHQTSAAAAVAAQQQIMAAGQQAALPAAAPAVQLQAMLNAAVGAVPGLQVSAALQPPLLPPSSSSSATRWQPVVPAADAAPPPPPVAG